MPEQPWDLVVVGGGTAGIVGSRTAATLGARTLMVERDRPGGDCLWTGCVPSKTLLAAAHHVADARRAADVGIQIDGLSVDFAAVMRRVHEAIAQIAPDDSPETLAEEGVEFLKGNAMFGTGGRLLVDGREIEARAVLLATGSSPAMAPIPGLAETAPLTSDTVWDITELPTRLVVLGGGSIGCELGQAFARLGSEVTIIEALPRLLPREDSDAAAIVTSALQQDGIRVLTGTKVVGVEANQAVLDDGQQIDFDRLLVAVGRSPRTRGIGLEHAAVEVDDRGMVRVDDALRTTNPSIWAAGDLTGHPQFTHVAGVHGALAASNAVLGLKRKVDEVVPKVTFTDPEVASVGVGTDETSSAHVVTRRHTNVDRAIAEGRTDGFTRLALDGKGTIVGATVVGPRAGESLAELTLAVRHKLSTRDLARSTHPYPTYADAAWRLATDDTTARLTSGVTGRAVDLLGGLRRRRQARRSG